MLKHRLKSTIGALGSESGFTLVESLVAMAAGLVVFGALFMVLDVAMSQTTRVISRSQTTQVSRTALSRIEDQLHSSCVGNDQTPIQPTSDGTTLSFLTGTGNAPIVTPVPTTITYTPGGSSGGTHGTLVETNSTTTDTLLGNVDQAVDTNGNPMPVFQYFNYQTATDAANKPYHDPSGKTYQMLLDGISPLPSGALTWNNAPAGGTTPPAKPLPAGQLGANAPTAAEVLITFVAYPEGTDTNQNLSDIGEPVRDGVVLRLTPVDNHDTGQSNVNPCA